MLEIYAREFKTELNWKLSVTPAYLKQKFQKSQATLVIKSLKHIKNSGKWEIEFKENEIIIFIPKFKELMSEGTLKKLRKHHKETQALSGQRPDHIRIRDVDVDVEVEEESTYCAKTDFSFFLFESFWDAFDDKKGKESAIKSWQKIPNLTDVLGNKIIEGAKQYAAERKNILAKGGTPKMAQGWLTDRRWEDEFPAEKDWKEDARAKLRKKEKELNDEI